MSLPNNNGPGRPQRSVPTLDLHGYRLAHAIRRLTDFLEEAQTVAQSQQVLVITGTGSHSNQGPVLRGAVEDLLNRRRMEHYRETPGCIRVLCHTGICFYNEERQQDTKVRVESADSEAVRLAKLQQQRGRRPQANLPHSSSEPLLMQMDSSSPLDAQGCPPLAQVMKAEKDFERGKEESLELARQSAKLLKREKDELKRAVDRSLDSDREEEQRQLELLQKALVLSEQQEASEREEDEKELELLQQALTLSEQQIASEKQAEEKERELLEHVLALSEQQQCEFTSDDEESLLQQVLQASLQHMDVKEHCAAAEEVEFQLAARLFTELSGGDS